MAYMVRYKVHVMRHGKTCQGNYAIVFRITYVQPIHLSSDAKLRLQPLTQFPAQEFMCFHI